MTLKPGAEKKKVPSEMESSDSLKSRAIFAASLSFLPGAGHLAIGKRGKAAAFFVVDLGIILSILFFKSVVTYLLAAFAYLMVMLPAVIETYVFVRGGVSRFSESKPYIVVMLLTQGFFAIPLLWNSDGFSNRAKIAWSIAVVVLALLYFSFLWIYGVQLFHYAKARFG